MSQPVGSVYKSKIPTLGDDASIEEALRVYHYGKDNYAAGQEIPDDSIEGNFRTLSTSISGLQSTISALTTQFVKLTSETLSPNVIVPQSVSTVPLTVRAIPLQTANLQNWENSSNISVAMISTAGSLALAEYLSAGSTTISSTIGFSLNIINSLHRGIVVRAAGSQTGNLQEWQNNSSTILSVIGPTGSFSTSGYISSGSSTLSSNISASINILNASHRGIVVRGFTSQTANLQEWQNSIGTVLASINSSGAFSTTSSITTTSSLSAASISTSGNISSGGSLSATTSISAASANISGDISSGGAITLSSAQTLDSFRVRNIRASTSQPSGGNDGDVWFVYV